MKNWTANQFVTYLFVISVVLYGLLFLFFKTVLPTPGIPLYIMIPVLFLFTSLAYIVLIKTKNKNPRNFVYSFMMISMGRLMMYGGFVFVYALSHRDNAKEFAISFFLLYMVYTALEIKGVLSYFKS